MIITTKKILIGCEESQAVTKAFRKLGHEAYSCDLLPCSGGHPEWHIEQDVLEVIRGGWFTTQAGTKVYIEKWDMGVFHPVCQFITNSGVRWLYNSDGTENKDRWNNLKKAVYFFNAIKIACMKNRITSFVLENPIPHKYARDGYDKVKGIGYYNQLIQPYQFGHTTTKATCLWLYNLPKLQHTKLIPKEKRTHEIHTCSPGPDRAKIRSKTFTGIAKAMAIQWSKAILK